MTRLEFDLIVEMFNLSSYKFRGEKDCSIRNIKIKYDKESGKAFIKRLPLNLIVVLNDKCPNLLKELKRSKDCSISNKENFINFIYTVKKYYNAEYFGVDEYINVDYYKFNLNKKILDSVVPKITIDEWMKHDVINDISYKRAVMNSKKKLFSDIVRSMLISFDQAVNPYMIKNVEMKNIREYTKNVTISGDTWSEKNNDNGISRNYCCNFTITDNKSKNYTSYMRYLDGFNCLLHFQNDEGKKIAVMHSYNPSADKNLTSGEYLTIMYLDKEEAYGYNYNISKNKLFEFYGDKHNETKLKMSNKIDIMSTLFTAINYGENITIKNMVDGKGNKILSLLK